MEKIKKQKETIVMKLIETRAILVMYGLKFKTEVNSIEKAIKYIEDGNG